MALQLRKDYTAGLQKAVNRFEFEVANISSVLTTEMCDLCMKVDRLVGILSKNVLTISSEKACSKPYENSLHL